jgi:hypothetical protein
VEKDLEVLMRLLKKWLRVQISNCYKKDLDSLVYRWRKTVEVDGDSVEKLGV